MTTGTAQLAQKLIRGDQIGRAESFGKPVVDRLQAGDGISGSAPIAQQAGEARGSAELPGQRTLSARPVERLPEVMLGRRRGSGRWRRGAIRPWGCAARARNALDRTAGGCRACDLLS